jgi:hypothetical protein
MTDMTENRKQVSGKYLEYKGKPLVREGNTICYGDMSDPCVLVLEIMSYAKDGDQLPDKVFIQVLEPKTNKIVRQGQKNSLYEAFSTGLIWLDLANRPAE